MPDTDFSSLKVVELKELCREKGLPVSGKKAELIERLEQASEKEAEAPPEPVRPTSVHQILKRARESSIHDIQAHHIKSSTALLGAG